MSNERNVQKLFDGYAVEFDSIYGGSRCFFPRGIDRWFRQSMRLRFEKTIASCVPLQQKRVLDVGCGPGQYSVLLAQMGAEEVIGVDFSSSMIEIARRRAKSCQAESRCKFIALDLMDYRPSQPFDYVIAMGVMDYITDAAPFLRKLAELSQGKVLLSFPRAGGLLAWQRKLRYRCFSHCELHLYNRSEIKSLMEGLNPSSYAVERIARDDYVEVQIERSFSPVEGQCRSAHKIDSNTIP